MKECGIGPGVPNLYAGNKTYENIRRRIRLQHGLTGKARQGEGRPHFIKFSDVPRSFRALANPIPPYRTIYVLLDSDECVRYVGVTRRQLADRLELHLKRPTNSHMRKWFRICKPAIRLLTYTPERRWEADEAYWIRWFRSRGALLNVDPGGVFRDDNGNVIKKWTQKLSRSQYRHASRRLEAIQNADSKKR